jgi:uncharacterized protein YcbX
MSPHLARIDLFPIKSLDGLSVGQATVLDSGALKGDRTYALWDQQDRFINGKRTAAIHRLRASYSDDLRYLTCSIEGTHTTATFDLPNQSTHLETWMSDYFGQSVTLKQNLATGFPDDTQAVGPTLISTATLTAISSWYPDLTLEAVRQRFRTNLEIDGVPAFWEDHLFSDTENPVRFAIGDVVLQGVNPCQRCIVPTRDALTGTPNPNFQKTFTQQRQATLPQWAPRSRFNHFYRLAVNTNIVGQAGKTLSVGDPVKLSDT